MSLDLTSMMQTQGMLGEETVDNSCWIIKTHAPLTQDLPCAFEADKVIYITRHPIDVFPSMMSLMFTQCHSIEPSKKWSEFKIWNTFTEHMLPKFAMFHDKLMKQSISTPTFFVSYEQLNIDPEPIVRDLFCFLLNVKSIEGTLADIRVKEVCGRGIKAEKNQLYQLKETSGRLCARKDHYTEAEIANINSVCRDYMHFWGFASHPTK